MAVVPGSALRSSRTVLIIDHGWGEPPLWLQQLARVFNVISIASLAGASAATEGHDVAAVVVVLSGPELATRPLVIALRRHTSFDGVSVFVIAESAPLIAADLCGLTDVHVLEPSSAEYDLALRIGATPPRMSSRPAPRRSSATSPRGSWRPESAVAVNHHVQLQRFCEESAARAEHAQLLCDRLAQRETQPTDRVRLLEELHALLSSIRSAAAMVRLTELENVLQLAEQVLSHSTSRAHLLVPRGVVGLLSAVRDLTAGAVALSRVDLELHRTRLLSALDR